LARKFETARLAFEPLTAAHTELCFELDGDPEVMRYLTGGRATPLAEVERMIAVEGPNRWAAFTRAEGMFVGWFALRPSAPDEYELGYRLRRAAWGHGYATEGSRALVQLAFNKWGAQRVWAQTMAVNTRSRRVMEACGLHYVRTFHEDWDDPIDGAEEGDVEYALRRNDATGY
jgi:RimJ/RimL family protein N-acetyltransferase